MSKTCTVLILTYKGIHHLQHLLPTVESSINNSEEFDFKVKIIDNGCSTDVMNFVREKFPEFSCQFAKSNDYLFSLNHFVKNISSPYTLILNDDMKLDIDALNEILPLIHNDPKLFSVGCNVLDWEGKNETIGVRILSNQKGWVENKFIPFENKKIRYTLFGGGGAAVFRTDMYNMLGGFNTLFRPAYGEDADLCHRAWHRGWPSIVNPKAILYHREGGTIHEQFSSDALEQRVRRNIILWMIRNVNIPSFLFDFFSLFPIRLFRWRKLHRNLYIASIMAIPRMPKALLQRLREPKALLYDSEIITILNKPYEIR